MFSIKAVSEQLKTHEYKMRLPEFCIATDAYYNANSFVSIGSVFNDLSSDEVDSIIQYIALRTLKDFMVKHQFNHVAECLVDECLTLNNQLHEFTNGLEVSQYFFKKVFIIGSEILTFH